MRFIILFIITFSLFNGPSLANDRDSIMTETIIAHLAKLKSEKKFTKSPKHFYPGAPNEKIRLKAENIINNLITRLEVGSQQEATKSFVMSQFKLTLDELVTFDSEETDRALMYLENIMDIYGIQSSDGLLNEWRYGFNPELK